MLIELQIQSTAVDGRFTDCPFSSQIAHNWSCTSRSRACITNKQHLNFLHSLRHRESIYDYTYEAWINLRIHIRSMGLVWHTQQKQQQQQDNSKGKMIIISCFRPVLSCVVLMLCSCVLVSSSLLSSSYCVSSSSSSYLCCRIRRHTCVVVVILCRHRCHTCVVVVILVSSTSFHLCVIVVSVSALYLCRCHTCVVNIFLCVVRLVSPTSFWESSSRLCCDNLILLFLLFFRSSLLTFFSYQCYFLQFFSRPSPWKLSLVASPLAKTLAQVLH